MRRRSFLKLIPFLTLAANAKIAPVPVVASNQTDQLRSGLKTYKELIEDHGVDWREVLRHRAMEAALHKPDLGASQKHVPPNHMHERRFIDRNEIARTLEMSVFQIASNEDKLGLTPHKVIVNKRFIRFHRRKAIQALTERRLWPSDLRQ